MSAVLIVGVAAYVAAMTFLLLLVAAIVRCVEPWLRRRARRRLDPEVLRDVRGRVGSRSWS